MKVTDLTTEGKNEDKPIEFLYVLKDDMEFNCESLTDYYINEISEIIILERDCRYDGKFLDLIYCKFKNKDWNIVCFVKLNNGKLPK